MIIKVKSQQGKVCRLAGELCVTDTPVKVEKTILVRRRLKDGSLIEVKESTKEAAK